MREIHYDGQESILDCVNEAVEIPGPAGLLEAATACPPQDRHSGIAAIICHPHPLYGGSLQNKVVYYLSKTCAELGVASVRFNFRGVGRSAGCYAEGVGETEDLLAVMDWVRMRCPSFRIWLAGFSFGAFVACRAALQCPRVERLITVAPPVNLFDFPRGEVPACPWLVVQGGRDEVVPRMAVEDYVGACKPSPEFMCLEEADHFFHGQLNALRSRLSARLVGLPGIAKARSCA